MMKISIDKINLTLSTLTFLTTLIGGGWVLYQYRLSGSNDWMNNLTIETQVMPYHDDLRLLIVHVKSKNPRNYEFTMNSKKGDTFELRFRKIPMNAIKNAIIKEDTGDVIRQIDLLNEAGGEYQCLPSAETDDMTSIVLPLNTIVSLTAEMNIHNDEKPGTTDFISASTIVRIEDKNVTK